MLIVALLEMQGKKEKNKQTDTLKIHQQKNGQIQVV